MYNLLYNFLENELILNIFCQLKLNTNEYRLIVEQISVIGLMIN